MGKRERSNEGCRRRSLGSYFDVTIPVLYPLVQLLSNTKTFQINLKQIYEKINSCFLTFLYHSYLNGTNLLFCKFGRWGYLFGICFWRLSVATLYWRRHVSVRDFDII